MLYIFKYLRLRTADTSNALHKVQMITLYWLYGIFFLFLIIPFVGQIEINNILEIKRAIPKIMWWQVSESEDRTIQCANNQKCELLHNKNTSLQYNDVEAYLFYGSSPSFLPLPRNQNIIWAFVYEETPLLAFELMHEKYLSLFNISSTFSRHSDVPFPMYFLNSIDHITSDKYFTATAIKNSLLVEIAPTLYLQSVCRTATERDEYVKELMKYTKIDSYGECLNNKVLPEEFKANYHHKLDDPDFLKFVGRYKFVIAIENYACDDYVTEKFWRPIEVGSVPIYFGSPLIRDWLPNSDSAILVEDFSSPQALGEYINQLNENDELYEKHLKHKTMKIVSNDNLINYVKRNPYQLSIYKRTAQFECFVCQQIYERKIGNIKMVTKSSINCPKPISILSKTENPSRIHEWNVFKKKAEELNELITNNSFSNNVKLSKY